MLALLGILGFAAFLAAFWLSLPKNGQTKPFVNTVWEPYVAIALTIGLTLSGIAIVVGIADFLV